MITPGGMHSSLSDAGIYTDFSGLAELRTEASKRSPEANKQVAQQFEAIFLQSMLKAMRQANHFDTSSESEQTQFYQDMFDKQISLELANKGGIGLAELMLRQFNGESEMAMNSVAEVNAGVQEPVVDKKDFIQTVFPHAQNAANELGVAPELLIAQAALETGWGSRIIKNANGESSNNLFGIKADRSWSGDRATVSTLEYRDGIARSEQAAFRSYSSFSESLDDYVNFLRDNPRYQQALSHASDSQHFLHELSRAGYATDPAYADKISAIMNDSSFRQTLSQI